MDALLTAAEHYARPFYAEPHRAYHNAAHVEAVLDALRRRGVLSPTLALAVWGHDLIYDPRAGDNEARSAQVFGEWLTEQDADPALVAEVRTLILATQHKALPATRDEALLVDADLSVLGAAPTDFAAYDQAIRQEYHHVPGPLYRLGRRKVLQSFLKRERIFSTPEFAELEASSRANLAGAVARL
ncbi:phosphohydrolase [Deinococcus sp. HMF7604]|uniref:HD domain-containing protein n=1 Tax=Deinococcus betulae TaxID=2873312 RepID=UPI001CCC233F|nr:phosphohydrolase [Deinococcus betulae]